MLVQPSPAAAAAASVLIAFADSYIAYDDLKSALKTPFVSEPTPQNPNPPRKPWNDDNETSFIRQLEQELDKVFTFQHVKSEDIARRVAACEQEVNDVVGRAHQDNPDTRPDEDQFILLEQDLSDVIADVHDLAKFTQLNYTGFQKIIKKHDVGRIEHTVKSCHTLTARRRN